MTDRIAGKAALDSAEAKMREDKRLEVSGEIPFNPKRLILGCFKPLYTMGRERDVRFPPAPARTRQRLPWVKPRRTQYEHMFSDSLPDSDIARLRRHVSNAPKAQRRS